MRKLRGGPWGAGRCLRLQARGLPVSQGVEATAPATSGEEGAAGVPKSPETETPVIQGGEGVGEAEVEEGGPPQTAMETGE